MFEDPSEKVLGVGLHPLPPHTGIGIKERTCIKLFTNDREKYVIRLTFTNPKLFWYKAVKW